MYTPDKRRSSIKLLPIPDGDIDTGDRRQIVGLYRLVSTAAWKIIGVPRTVINKILGVKNDDISKVMGV